MQLPVAIRTEYVTLSDLFYQYVPWATFVSGYAEFLRGWITVMEVKASGIVFRASQTLQSSFVLSEPANILGLVGLSGAFARGLQFSPVLSKIPPFVCLVFWRLLSTISLYSFPIFSRPLSMVTTNAIKSPQSWTFPRRINAICLEDLMDACCCKPYCGSYRTQSQSFA